MLFVYLYTLYTFVNLCEVGPTFSKFEKISRVLVASRRVLEFSVDFRNSSVD